MDIYIYVHMNIYIYIYMHNCCSIDNEKLLAFILFTLTDFRATMVN